MTKRQFGALRKLPSGRWQARYRDHYGRTHTGPDTFDTKADAGRYLDHVRTQMDRGEWHDYNLGRLTLAEWSERWLAGKVLKPKTELGYRSLLDSRILPTFGDVALASIKPSDLRTWSAAMARGGLSASRRRQALQLVRQILDAGVADDLIRTNPAAAVDLPSLPEPKAEYLTADEAARLIAATPRPWDALVMMLIFGGLRWGEAVALRRGHCDLLRSQLLVSESAAEVAGRVVIGDTKTHQRRTVFLPPPARARLAEHLAGLPGADRDALVFTAPRGGVVRYSNFRRRVWMPALDAAGLDHYGTHIGRHTSATLLLAAGAGVKDVQAHLGQKDAAMTLNVYCAPYDGKRAELAARLGAAWEAVESNAARDSPPFTVASGTQVARPGRRRRSG